MTGPSGTRSAALAAMAVAAVATLVSIDRQPLSWDEAVTLGAAERSPHQLVAMLGHTDAPLGLYYFLMQGWLWLGDLAGIGTAAGWLRLPSAAAAIAAVGLLVAIVATWFDRRTALLAGVLFAVHPMLTFYAQDARPYTLVVCAFLASTWLLLRALERPDARRLAAYAVVAVLALYLHLFVGYAFAAHAVLVIRRREHLRRWVVVAVAVAVAATPLLLVARGQGAEIGWIARPTSGLVLAVLTHMFGGAWLAALLTVLTAAAVVHRRRLSEPMATLLLWLVVPLAMLVAVDLVLPDLVARYGLVCVPAAVTLAVLGAGRRHRASSQVIVAVLVVVAGITTWHQQRAPFKYEDYRAADDTMGDLASPGDAVMFFPQSMRAGYDVYRGIEPDLLNVRDAALAPGGSPLATGLIGGQDQSPASIPGLFASAPRIFVLGTSLAALATRHLGPTDAAELSALQHYRVVRSIRWGVVTLTVLQRAPRTA